MESTLITLQQLYLGTLANLAEHHKLDTVLLDAGENKGRLFLVRNGTTMPDAHIAFEFGIKSVHLAIETRNEKNLVREVLYLEGLDAFLREFDKVLSAGLLASPAKRAA